MNNEKIIETVKELIRGGKIIEACEILDKYLAYLVNTESMDIISKLLTLCKLYIRKNELLKTINNIDVESKFLKEERENLMIEIEELKNNINNLVSKL